MSSEQRLYTLYAEIESDRQQAARFAIEVQSNGQLSRVEFQYLPAYLNHPSAIPALPGGLELQPEVVSFTCHGGGIPGFIDNLLPDAWGQKLIARSIARQSERRQPNIESRQLNIESRQPTIADFLSYPSTSTIGCFACSEAGDPAPQFGNGMERSRIAESWDSADRLQKSEDRDTDLDILRLAGSSGIGGARPKALVFDDRHWIAKFSRTVDDYNIVEAEHVALQIAREAGLPAPESTIATINGRQALLVERFDITSAGHRRQLISANSLLKVDDGQGDPLHASYQDLARLVKRYSTAVQADLYQLFGHAMLNSALNNTDDHLRNFGFLLAPGSVRLSPIYDVVPSPVSGQYSQLNWHYSPFLPQLEDAGRAAKEFGLPSRDGIGIAERIATAISHHVEELQSAGGLPPRYKSG